MPVSELDGHLEIGRAGAPRDSRREEPERPSVFQRLRRDIVAGRIEPGAKLRVEHLKARYGVGASPLREALSHMVADGLVELVKQKGFRAASVSLEELRDIADLRLQLEVMALGRSIADGDDAWEARVLSAHHRLSKLTEDLEGADADTVDEWEARHRIFHITLGSACGSPWLMQFCDRLYDHAERYRRTFWAYTDRVPGARDEHLAIRDGALARDAKTACKLLEGHIRAQTDLTAAAMRSRGF